MNLHLKKILNKCLLQSKHEDEEFRGICNGILKNGGIREMAEAKVVRKQSGKRLIAYINLGNLPNVKAEEYIRTMRKYISDFFNESVLIMPIRPDETGHSADTRIEQVEL